MNEEMFILSKVYIKPFKLRHYQDNSVVRAYITHTLMTAPYTYNSSPRGSNPSGFFGHLHSHAQTQREIDVFPMIKTKYLLKIEHSGL